jgi:hypothetical protein
MVKKNNLKNIIKYSFLAIFAFILIVLLTMSVKLKDYKNYYSQMTSGKHQLENAVDYIKKQKYSDAKKETELAVNSFEKSLEALSNIKDNPAAYLKPINISLSDLEYLTKTAEILSKSLLRTTSILAKLEEVTSGRFTDTFSELSETDRRQILEIIYQSSPELNGLNANLKLSLENLNKIHKIGVLLPLNSQIANIKEQLITATDLMDQLIPLTRLLPSLTGYPQESEFLVVLQNNDELRPTGGFIGTYGLMTIKDGKPSNIITEDVYHLDMPCVGKLKTTPPAPIKKYMGVEYWWLRDANFSPDFPTSAAQIETMFLSESQCALKEVIKPTAVIAINPGLIADLLGLVGSITVDDTTYDRNNFQPLLQYNVEVAYVDKNISSWDRKEIINEVVSELKDRLFSLPTNKMPEVLKILKENIAQKNIQLYFSNSEQQKVVESIGMAGEIKKVSSDYLMVVDANLAAFKSDSVMKKNISYQVSGNSKLESKVTLQYIHNGGFDWRTTRYRSYTRIYAPLGSRLKDSGGLDDFSVSDDATLEKTVFGFFWTIEPGQEKTISISYYLPEKITNTNYRLYFQKQSGSRLNNFNFITSSQNWNGTLDRDKIFN